MTKKGKTKKPGRLRTERRAQARSDERLAAHRRRLHALEAGGSPDHPIELVSAAQIEPHARSLRCARCDHALHVEESASSVRDGHVHRAVSLRCRSCGEGRTAHFVVVERRVH